MYNICSFHCPVLGDFCSSVSLISPSSDLFTDLSSCSSISSVCSSCGRLFSLSVVSVCKESDSDSMDIIPSLVFSAFLFFFFLFIFSFQLLSHRFCSESLFFRSFLFKKFREFNKLYLISCFYFFVYSFKR